MVWGFKNCNFVHSANARPFVLRFWPFKVTSRRHLELWPSCAQPCPDPSKLMHRKITTKESSVPKLLDSSRDIRVIISQNRARMRCNWVRMNPRLSVTTERCNTHRRTLSSIPRFIGDPCGSQIHLYMCCHFCGTVYHTTSGNLAF